jgi:hypothetical protein
MRPWTVQYQPMYRSASLARAFPISSRARSDHAWTLGLSVGVMVSSLGLFVPESLLLSGAEPIPGTEQTAHGGRQRDRPKEDDSELRRRWSSAAAVIDVEEAEAGEPRTLEGEPNDDDHGSLDLRFAVAPGLTAKVRSRFGIRLRMNTAHPRATSHDAFVLSTHEAPEGLAVRTRDFHWGAFKARGAGWITPAGWVGRLLHGAQPSMILGADGHQGKAASTRRTAFPIGWAAALSSTAWGCSEGWVRCTGTKW